MMRLLFLFLICLANSSHAESVVATVNGQKITLQQLNQAFQNNLNYFQYAAPSKKQVLEDMIQRELGIQEAKKRNLMKDPIVIQKMNTVLYQSLLEKDLKNDLDRIQITTSQAKAYYERHPELRTRHIFVGISPGAKASQKNEALQKIKKIQAIVKQNKKPFSEIAKQYSEGAAAKMGGDIGYQSIERLDPAYYQAAWNLRKPGRVSGIVQSQYGYHIIKLIAVKPWKRADPNKVKRAYFEEKKKQLFESYMAKLRKKSSVKVNWKLVR